MIIINCKNCGKEIETYPCKIPRKKYCSHSCRGKVESKGNKNCVGMQLWLGKKHKPESIEKIKKAKKGQRCSPRTEFVKGAPPWNKGLPAPWATKRNLLNNPGKKGAENPMWKGGVSTEAHKIRTSDKYKNWRTSVFIRDKYTCQDCGQIGGKLNADHIKPFSLFPELRFDIENGRTLCEKCHKKTDTYGFRLVYKKVV